MIAFIRAGYVWFIIAMAMLAFVPVYTFGVYMSLSGSNMPFSHAFFGAYRRALTVGFIISRSDSSSRLRWEFIWPSAFCAQIGIE